MVKRDTSKRTFEEYLEGAVKAPFSGWNFEYITRTGRMLEAPLKWNYHNVVLPWLREAKALLDMGTGGGEVLSRFHRLPPVTFAIEQYKPNVAVARERLGPLGVKVFEIEEEKEPPFNTNLPFDDGFFDLVISRHEAYYPQEIIRILKSKGIFITQQVGSISLVSLKQFLTARTEAVSNWNLKSAVDELKSAGFQIIEQQEDVQFYRFYDIGAVAYFMKAIPWIIEDFSIEKYKDKLRELYIQIQENGFYDTPLHRFIIVAQKG